MVAPLTCPYPKAVPITIGNAGITSPPGSSARCRALTVAYQVAQPEVNLALNCFFVALTWDDCI